MKTSILLPAVIACLLSFSFCKKEPMPIVFTVTNNLTGEPVPNATIKWHQVAPPSSFVKVVGTTDIRGQLSWNLALDTLPDPQTNFFTCESPGFYVERFSFTDRAQKTFDVKMRQDAIVEFNLQYQNSTAPKSFFIYEQVTYTFPLGGNYQSSWLIYSAHNKTQLDELLQKPLPNEANTKYHCFKIDSLDYVNAPMPANRLPENLIPDHIFEIPGLPQQPVYTFDVLW